jgi:hypothetical protein
MMKVFLLFIVFSAALLFYLKNNNPNSDIGTIQNEGSNRIESSANERAVNQEGAIHEGAPQVAAALVKNKRGQSHFK